MAILNREKYGTKQTPVRLYGQAPYEIFLLYGSMRPLAELLITTETMPSDTEIGTVHGIVEAMRSRSGIDLLVDELHCQIHSSEPVIPHRTDRTFVGRMAGDDICGALSPIVTPYNSHWDSSSDNVDAIPYINDIPFDDSAYAAVWAEAQAIRMAFNIK